MKSMKATTLILTVWAGATIVGALWDSGGDFYRSAWYIAIVAVFFVVQVYCLFLGRFSLKRIGFYAGHIGILLVIAAMVLQAWCGEAARFNIPVSATQSFGEVQMEDGRVTSFGFRIGVKDFQLEYVENEVSQYRAVLEIADGTTESQYPMAINHPVNYGGWRFYLMDFDQTAQSYVALYAKRDPGNAMMVGGLWLLMAGVAIMCFAPVVKQKERVP